jgi:hypothetical protein
MNLEDFEKFLRSWEPKAKTTKEVIEFHIGYRARFWIDCQREKIRCIMTQSYSAGKLMVLRKETQQPASVG